MFIERPVAAPLFVFAMISSWKVEWMASEDESGQMIVESRVSKIRPQFKLHQAVKSLGMRGLNVTNGSKDEMLATVILESKCINMS